MESNEITININKAKIMVIKKKKIIYPIIYMVTKHLKRHKLVKTCASISISKGWGLMVERKEFFTTRKS